MDSKVIETNQNDVTVNPLSNDVESNGTTKIESVIPVPYTLSSSGKRTLRGDLTLLFSDPFTALVTATTKQEPPTGLNSRTRTVFLMLNTMIGSGVLNQPQVFAKSGIVGALLLFTISGYFIWLGTVVLVDCGLRYQVTNYQALAGRVLGTFISNCIAHYLIRICTLLQAHVDKYF